MGSIPGVSMKTHDVTVVINNELVRKKVDSAKLNIVDRTHPVLASDALYCKKRLVTVRYSRLEPTFSA